MKNKNKTFRNNSQSGFSVAEIVITIFILTIVGAAIVNFQLDIFSLNKISGNNLINQEDARRALKTMTAEIRSMSPSNTGAYALAQVATSSLTFYTNTDSDVLKEKVRYFLSGTTLKKGVTKPSGNPLIYNTSDETFIELVHNVTNATTSIFTYYNTNYDGTSEALVQPIDPYAVRLIKINISIDDNPLKSPLSLYMTTQVSIRNAKDNL